jgi:hypothetical protein
VNEHHIVPIIIPLHNESEIVARLCDNLNDFLILNPNQVFILVCDYCEDNTFIFLSDFFRFMEKIIVVQNIDEPGYGSAIRYGFKIAYSKNYSWAITIDSDLSNPLNNVIELSNYILSNFNTVKSECVLIKGNRFHYLGASFNSALFPRVLLTVTANRIAKILTFGVSMDPTNGYRAVNLSWFMKIVFKENSFPAIMEELYFAIKSGNKIVDFPTALEYKEALRINSSLSLNFKNIVGYLNYLIKILVLNMKTKKLSN